MIIILSINNKEKMSDLSNIIIRYIISSIEENKLEEGIQIPGAIDLSNKFNLSKNCVREALKSLKVMGIIYTQPGKGTFVAKHAKQTIKNNKLIYLISNEEDINDDLIEIRFILEEETSYLAAKRANEKDIKELVNILEKLKEINYSNNKWREIGFEFHMKIAETSKNIILVKLLNLINYELITQRSKLNLDISSIKESLKDHEDIINAIKNKKPNEAKKLMHDHLERSKKLLT